MKAKLLRKIRKRYHLVNMLGEDIFGDNSIYAMEKNVKSLGYFYSGRYDHPSFYVVDTKYTALQVFIQQTYPFIGKCIVRRNKLNRKKRENRRAYIKKVQP